MPNMGMKHSTPPRHSGLADALFPGTKQRVLGLLFGQPSRSFYATELIGLAASGSGAVQRELANLAEALGALRSLFLSGCGVSGWKFIDKTDGSDGRHYSGDGDFCQ